MAKGITDILGSQPDSHTPSTGPIRKRIVDRLDRRRVNVLTAIGFAAPVLVYFWMVHHYSVNVIVGDQWDDVTVIEHSYTHLFDWGSLWAPHNENRIFFPNLVVLLLARTTQFNIQVEEYLSAMMLSATTALLIWVHKRRSPSTPWLYYCPVVLLAFSIVQYGNSLWGFQMAWYMVMLSLVSAMALLDRPTLTWLVLLGAIGAAVVGSFSSLQGLLIWPAGLVLLYHRRRHLSFVLIWFTAAVASATLYFYNFNTHAIQPDHNGVLQYPLDAIKFFLFEVGDVVGLQNPGSSDNGILLFGLAMVILAACTLVGYGIRRDQSGGGPIGVALICVGLLFAATVSDGRLPLGYGGASGSRYTTFDLLIPIGIYLALLGRPTIVARQSDGHPAAGRLRLVPNWIDRRGLSVARSILALVIVLQIGLGLHYAARGLRDDYAYKSAAVRVLRHIKFESNYQVVIHLYIYTSPSFIRKQANFLESHHLSLFADY